jgi:hypothetical protein
VSAVDAINPGDTELHPAITTTTSNALVLFTAAQYRSNATNSFLEDPSLKTVSISEQVTASSGVVNLTVSGGDTPTFQTAGATVNILAPATTYTLELPNIIDGSRFQVFNVTSDTELTNALVSGGTGIDQQYILDTDYSANDIGRLRITFQSGTTCKQRIELDFSFGNTTTVNNLPTEQVDDPVYTAYGVDGSTITEFSWDSGNIQVDIDDADNTTVVQRIAAWMCYFVTTATGIDEAFGSLDWESLNSIKINTDTVDLKLDNTKATPLFLNGGRLYRDDSTTIIASTSNAIQVDYAPVYIAETGVSGLTASESTQLFALGTPGAVADAVWDEPIADHLAAGSTGEALNDAQGDPADVIADAVWDEALSGHLTAGTFGLSAAIGGRVMFDGSIIGTPTSTTIQLDGGSAVDDFYKEELIYFAGGPATGLIRSIIAWDGTTKTATLDAALPVVPNVGNRAIIQGAHIHSIPDIQDGLASQASIDALNDLSAADVNAEVDQALADYDGPTKAELDAAQTAIQDDIALVEGISPVEVKAQVDQALIDYDPPTKAELDAAQTAIQDDIALVEGISPTEVKAQVDQGLADYDGPTKAELDAAFTEIKGAGWTNETLVDIRATLDDLDVDVAPTDLTATLIENDRISGVIETSELSATLEDS